MKPSASLLWFVLGLGGCGTGVGDYLLREIGGTLEGVLHSADPFPRPTATGQEASVSTPTIENTGPTSFRISFDYTPTVPMSWGHIEIGGEHFIKEIPASADEWQPNFDACDYYAQVMGSGGCTAACVQACGCVECSGSDMVGNLVEGACAVTCSGWSKSGLIGPGQHWPNEAAAAYAALTGNDEYLTTGIIASVGQGSCSASRCKRAADGARHSVAFDVVGVTDWSFIGNLDVGSCTVSTQPAPDDGAVVSPSASGASVNPQSACDPGPCKR